MWGLAKRCNLQRGEGLLPTGLPRVAYMHIYIKSVKYGTISCVETPRFSWQRLSNKFKLDKGCPQERGNMILWRNKKWADHDIIMLERSSRKLIYLVFVLHIIVLIVFDRPLKGKLQKAISHMYCFIQGFIKVTNKQTWLTDPLSPGLFYKQCRD